MTACDKFCHLNMERGSELRGIRELARGSWSCSHRFCVSLMTLSYLRQMVLANFQCSLIGVWCVLNSLFVPANSIIVVSRSTESLKLYIGHKVWRIRRGIHLNFIFVPAAVILSFDCCLVFDFIPMHLDTECCPKLLCCSEINQEIILVQTCEIPRKGLKNATWSAFPKLYLFLGWLITHNTNQEMTSVTNMVINCFHMICSKEFNRYQLRKCY